MNARPICRSSTVSVNFGESALTYFVDCPRCGKYFFDEAEVYQTARRDNRQRANVSGFLRENPKFCINYERIVFLSRLRTTSVGERANKLFKFLARNHQELGAYITIPHPNLTQQENQGRHPYLFGELMSESWADQDGEVYFLLDKMLVGEHGYLVKQDPAYYITPRGWTALEEATRKPGTIESECFVAMWFDNKMDPPSRCYHSRRPRSRL